jgi:molybdenum cofactor guanylyltransferase
MSSICLGILAGGIGSRVKHHDKLLLKRSNVSQLDRFVHWSAAQKLPLLLNSNRPASNYQAWNISVIPDDIQLNDVGVAAGIISLIQACDQEYLLTLPADVQQWPDNFHQSLLEVAQTPDNVDVVLCRDSNGLQPLCALWNAQSCRTWLANFLYEHHWAIHSLSKHARVSVYELADFQFGNLNTLDDYDSL